MKEETRQAAAMKKILDKRDAREYKKAKEAEKEAGQQDAAAGEEKVFNQVAYMNEYNRNKYDRVNLTMPKGKKAIVKQRAQELRKSVNEYINDLIAADLKEAETDGK